ncbi:MAG: CPBP family intramembrane metalloprotease [Anaerolineae bacterium]|nr:CPBP family intramembrane metalloprotease [Anaerolineae bacterium]
MSEAVNQSVSTSKGLLQVMRNRPLFYFFVLSYAFSWLISLPYVLSVWGILPGDYTIGFALKQWGGPALAGIIMASIVEGRTGRLNLRHRIRDLRAGWQWYLFILLGIPALILLGVVIQPGARAGFQGFTGKAWVSYPIYFVIVFFGVGLPEEIGWRGFALPRMQLRFGPLRSSLLLGALWAFWHLLCFLLPDHGGGPDVSLVAFLINFSVFFLMVVALTLIFTWVFNGTHGSIFIASLLHAAIDTPQLVWLPLFLGVGASNSTKGETALNLAVLVVFGTLALLILILTRGRLGYQSNTTDCVGETCR